MARTNAIQILAMTFLLLPWIAAATPPAPSARAGTTSSAQHLAPLRLEIDLSERTLYVRYGGDVQSYPVAVGMPEYPTPTGNFTISQVTWNPDWRPPESEWSEDESYMEFDDPDNPMGKVKMMWKAPDYTIHGTDGPESLGKNVSHGSVRLADEIAIQLAKRVMAHGDVQKSASWFETAGRDDSDQHVVELPNPISIDVHQ